MEAKSQTSVSQTSVSQTGVSQTGVSSRKRLLLVLLAVLAVLPSVHEGVAVAWGNAHGMTGKALRDGLDFWAGGFLGAHGRAMTVFDPAAYRAFLAGVYGAKLPIHMWSYPPNYLLLASGFGWLAPWHAVIAFDVVSLALLAFLLRLSGQTWWLVAAVVFSPASFENVLEGQNAALMTALIGGGLLVLAVRPRLGGALVGLASIKPQLGIVLPLYLLRQSRVGFAWAVMASVLLGWASVLAFGAVAWAAFVHVTGPAMSGVLWTGKPKEFAGGLISVFAAVKQPFGLHAAVVAQVLVTLGCVVAAARTRKPEVVLVLAALASPYLHVYDLLGSTLVVALLLRKRLRTQFYAGEPVLFFIAWFGPGELPWMPVLAHLTPVILLLLLASAAARGRLPVCSEQALSAGPLPIPDPPSSTVIG